MSIEIIDGLEYVTDFSRDIESLKKESISKKYYLKLYCSDCNILLKKNKFSYIRDVDANGNIYCRRCSLKHVDKAKRNETFKKTCLAKYGVENPFQADVVKDKIKKSNLEKYGVEHNSQTEQFKKSIKEISSNRTADEKADINDKRRKTVKEKYNVESVAQLDEVKCKKEQTCINKYGVSTFLKTEECKNALKEKFNVTENISQSKYWKDKVYETSKNKFGVKWFTKAPDVKEKSTQTCISHFGVPYYAQSTKFKSELAINIFKWQKEALERRDLSKYFIEPLYTNNTISFKCTKCGNIWSPNKIGQSSKFFVCNKCFPNGLYNGRSSYEDFICSILSSNNIQFLKNDRKSLGGKEIDIFVPSLNIGIEIDGVYWHSLKDKYYHLEKTELALSKDIRLVHITDILIDTKPDIVKSFIENLISKNKKVIYARNCYIKNIDEATYKNFCNKYHIQGYVSAKIKIGLFYNNELVQIMSFSKPRFNKHYQYELIREVSNSEYRIVGGKNKLLKYFERSYKPTNLISYCDRRWFTGKSYIDIGFKLEGTTIPSYNYYNDTDILSRYQCQKHKLSKILKNFDDSISEYQNMINNGYYRVFDCGQLVFTKDYTKMRANNG